MIERAVAVFFLLLFLGFGVVAFWAVMPEDLELDPEAYLAAAEAYEVRIIRDAYGVPHIYGKRDADVAYGLAFAHAEDDFLTIQKVGLATRGRLSAVEGIDAAPIDFMVQWMGVWDAVDAGYESEISAETRAIAEAYAVGVNHYAALHPEAVLPGAIPFSGRDIVAGFAFKTPLFYGFQQVMLELFEEDRQRDLALSPTENAFHLTDVPQPILGSNAVAVGPGRSADGATRLLINSHQPYTGPVAWYEVRLHSEEGWDVAGGVFPGGPVMLHGANRHLAWASTVNQPDLADVYVLDVDPDDQNRYRLDGEWRAFEQGEASFAVKLLGRLRWTVTRELLKSMHGPVLRRPHGTYGIRFVGMGEIRGVEQYMRMNKARSVDEWRDAMRMQALPSINFVYADEVGNMGYVYNARFPKRREGWDWKGYLPGDRSDLVWTEYHTYDEAPQLMNPSSQVVTNANSDPFHATVGEENLKRENYPESFGIERRMTNRALRALELYGGDDSITAEEFRAYKFDKRYSAKSAAREIVATILAADPETLGDDPDYAEARELLAAWDFTATAASRTAPIAIISLTPVVVAMMKEEPPLDPLDTFRDAVAVLRQHHGRLDPTWGEVNRFHRGDLELPADGGPDVLRALEAFVLDEDGTYSVKSGDSLVMFVEWDAEGKQRVETVHQYGSATLDRASPHFADQVPLFLSEGTKKVLWTLEELLPTATRDYRPGESG
ncbi:MAG: acylase [bacterium]|nr:acylase [bacterium]